MHGEEYPKKSDTSHLRLQTYSPGDEQWLRWDDPAPWISPKFSVPCCATAPLPNIYPVQSRAQGRSKRNSRTRRGPTDKYTGNSFEPHLLVDDTNVTQLLTKMYHTHGEVPKMLEFYHVSHLSLVHYRQIVQRCRYVSMVRA